MAQKIRATNSKGEKKAGAGNSGGPEYRYEGPEIFLDKEGRWFHEGVEITHELTAALFSRSVQKDPAGGYRLVVGKEYAHIRVEDTPYMVKRVSVEGSRVELKLNDDTFEDLDPTTLRVGAKNVLYCEVKGGEFPARFLSAAYYELMKCLEETKSGYAVRLGEELWPIRMGKKNSQRAD